MISKSVLMWACLQSVSAGKQVVDTDFAAALRGDGGGGGSDTDSSDESGDRYKTRPFF